MKRAVAFRKHAGPIQESLKLAAAERGFDVLVTNKRDMNVGHPWNDYDNLLWFDNKPPILRTSAKIFWWMCDLRSPATLGGTTTASCIGVCNTFLLREYERFYGKPTIYLPQCGNDTEAKKGRSLNYDILFLGHLGKPSEWDHLSVTASNLKKSILSRQFHWNRMPIVGALEKAGLSVKVISREGATLDSKWLYQSTPINLSISLPVEGYTSNRLYNILSSEGFCLAAWFPGLEKLFRNHKHLVWFKTIGEAIELAKHYLDRPEERNRIRREGNQEYLAKHTAGHRVDRMIEALS